MIVLTIMYLFIRYDDIKDNYFLSHIPFIIMLRSQMDHHCIIVQFAYHRYLIVNPLLASQRVAMY